MDFSFSDLNFNSVETLPGFEARAAFTLNPASVFKEDVDMVPQGWHELSDKQLRFVYQLLADNFATDISLEQAFNTYGIFIDYGTGSNTPRGNREALSSEEPPAT